MNQYIKKIFWIFKNIYVYIFKFLIIIILKYIYILINIKCELILYFILKWTIYRLQTKASNTFGINWVWMSKKLVYLVIISKYIIGIELCG